jgi:SAM-dependent methyltransferase
MFALTDADLRLKIVGCGDGPSGFNAEATRRGADVISIDPIYRWDTRQLQERIAATCDEILEQTRRNAHEFVWESIPSVQELGRVRMAAMQEFLDDYARGNVQGRYLDAELPSLPFRDSSFDLALCSHFLFLYSDQLGEAFHQMATREMCRVSREVRIFPLLALGGARSKHVDRILEEMRNAGHEASVETVAYEFQRGGNQMMRIRSGSCK